MAVKWSSLTGGGPSADDLVNMYSNGPAPAAAKASSGIGGGGAGPDFASVLGQATGTGLAWTSEDQARYGLNAATAAIPVHDSRTQATAAGANIRELERTGGKSGAGVVGTNLNDSTIGQVLQRLSAMGTNELTILQQKLYQAGYYGNQKPEDIRFGVNDGSTMQAFTQLLGDSASTSGDKTWAELLDQQVATKKALAATQGAANLENDKLGYLAKLTSAENAYRSANSTESRAAAAQVLQQVKATAPTLADGSIYTPDGHSGLPSLEEHFDPDIKVQNLDPTAARDALNAAFADAVGRAPTADELAAFTANYTAAAKAAPLVTTATRDASGATTTSTSGGVDAQPIAEAEYIHSPEYANYQAVSKFFPAIERVLAGKDLTTLR